MERTNFLEVWKGFYNEYSNFFDEKIKEDFPSQAVGQVLEMNLLFKKMLDETTEQYLDQVNMPTKNDIASVSSLVVNVDAKVDELEEAIDEMKSIRVGQPEIQHEIAAVKEDITKVKDEVSDLKTAVAAVKSEVANSQKNIKSLDHKLNEVLFLLKNQKK